MSKEKLVLAIETSLKKGSLSLLSGENEIGCWQGNEVVSRSEDLVSGIGEILAVNGLSINDLDLIAVSTGPGSFTGLRVGIAVAKGLKLALACPLAGVSILEALVFSYEADKADKVNKAKKASVSLVLTGAGRDNFYWQTIKRSGEAAKPEEISEIRMSSFDDLMAEFSGLADKTKTIVLEESISPQILNLITERNIKDIKDIKNIKNIKPEMFIIRKNPAQLIGKCVIGKNIDTGGPAIENRDVFPLYVREL